MSDVPQGTLFPAFSGGEVAWVGVVGPGLCRDSGRFEKVLEQLEARGFGSLVIDLARCPRIDSTFAGSLLRLAQRSIGQGGGGPVRRIVLNRPTEQVRDTVDTLCLGRFFELAEMAVPESLSALSLESGDLSKEEIMALSLEGHERLAALSSDNARRFATLLSVLREQLGASEGSAHRSSVNRP